MPYEHKEGQGSAFPNGYKTEDRHPDWKGQALIDGKMRDIAMWTKQGGKGNFLSIKVTDAREQGESRRAPAPRGTRLDEIPF